MQSDILETYQAFVVEVCSLPSKSTQRDMLMTAGLGLGGEAGDVAGLVKNHLFHGHPLDRQALTDELGDVLWHLALAATANGVTLTEVMERNMAKLRSRQPSARPAEPRRNRAVAVGD